jgi:hypothetical protein
MILVDSGAEAMGIIFSLTIFQFLLRVSSCLSCLRGKNPGEGLAISRAPSKQEENLPRRHEDTKEHEEELEDKCWTDAGRDLSRRVFPTGNQSAG